MPTAPNYQPASQSAVTCDTCAFADSKLNLCKKYKFTYENSYVCDDWEPADLGLSDVKLGSAAWAIKFASIIGKSSANKGK